MEQTPIYNSINWQVGCRWGPGRPGTQPDVDPNGDGVLNLYGIMQATAIATEIKSFICPSDPNPGQLDSLGWTGQQRRVGTTSYANNIGLNRHANDWRFNGPSYIGTSWDGALKPTVTMATFVDGTSNTVVWSEWVRGPASRQKNGLGLVYRMDANSDRFNGQLNPDYQFAQYCQLNAVDLSTTWAWKGEYWIQGDRNNYSHTQLPNKRSCSYANAVDVDGRGTLTMMSASSMHPGGVNCGFMDGSVKFIKDSITPAAWYAIATPNGGEVVSMEQYTN